MFGRISKITILSALAAIAVLACSIVAPMKASAEYVEGNLVDDTLFLDAASMSHASIQSFLSSRGGALANYYSWSDRDNATVSAAQIIYEAAYDYGVSPKVILATLQKEQSLVTAKNPTSYQYNFAMGYGCPDSTGCGANYSGFYRQVDNGAWQLRYNFERARGNNTWWRNSSSYACGGATRYYSTGLYQGRTVTFLDEAGYGYKTFRLNGAATASMYCYTPHAYPGSPQYYYSGSYNFVTAYESWFGSTQPGLVVSSALNLTASGPVAHANAPLTAWFTVTNNTNAPINAGRMTIAVRGPNGENYDNSLQQITVPAFSTITYASTQSYPKEGAYTFWISHLSDAGAWSNSYPQSSSIDNKRQITASLQSAPLITSQPTPSSDLRESKATNFTFTVKNTSQSSIDIGKVGLAVRGPNGENVDMPLRSVVIPANGTYTYNEGMRPPRTGNYTVYITNTVNNGLTWNETSYPATASGVNRRVTVNAASNPTLTQGPQLSVASPRVGQAVNATFKVRNYADKAIPMGYLGMAIRDPLGRNVDPGVVNLTVNAESEYTFQANGMAFQTPGTYTAWITGTRDGGRTWDDNHYPALDSSSVIRRITFTVLPNPTITVQPTITTTDARVGKATTATFTIHNYGSQPVDLGYVAVASRDPHGRNADFALQRVVIQPESDYVYTATNPGGSFQTPGTYTAWVTVYRNGAWDDTSYPVTENAQIQRRINYNVKSSPTLTQGPALSVASPSVGQTVNASFKIKNFGDYVVNAGQVGLAIRDPQGRNVDAGSVGLTIDANSEYTFQANGMAFQTPGTYTAWVTVYRNGAWDDTSYPTAENGTIQRKITFTVQP